MRDGDLGGGLMTDQPLESSHGFASGLSAEVIRATPPDLATWLREQIDEDEQAAQAARHGVSGRWRWMPRGAVEFGPEEDDWPEWSSNGVVVYDSDAPTSEQAEHIARHDPARVLREVEAKRAIVDHAEVWFAARHTTSEGWDERTATAYRMAMEWVLQHLALPYADRPGYREEWRP